MGDKGWVGFLMVPVLLGDTTAFFGEGTGGRKRE